MPKKMRKVRVYQLARELRVTNEVLFTLLEEVGTPVTSHTSSVDTSVAEEVRSRVAGMKRKGGTQVATRPRPGREPAEIATTGARRGTPEAPPVPEPAQIWSISPLPKAPEVGTAAVDSGTAAVPAPPPLARRVGPAVPTTRREPKSTDRRPARADRPAAVDVTRTYRPGAPSRGPGAPPGRGGRPADRRPAGRKGKKKKRRRAEEERETLDSVRRTMASLEGSRTRKKHRVRRADGTEVEVEDTKVRINEFATVSELAATIGARPNEVITTCLRLGVVANINRRLDRDTIEAVVDEFDLEVEFIKEFGEEMIEQEETEVGDLAEESRPAIVTIMGHVDHGKTKLLDHIRNTDVISGEAGGITQHIGAYQTRMPDGRTVTFLDTPGHQAFTSMRARGADVTDIVVLVVAADDRVNEQTIEAINHARAARKPIIVAINKIDLAQADPEKIKQQLSEQGLQVEDWGGDVVAVEISAKFGQNVDKLLEMILLVAELGELQAVKDRSAKGTIIEAKKDPGRGILATVLIQSGTLKLGDAFICGASHGKVRAMVNERMDRLESAGPSTPVEVLGWAEVPQVGDSFSVVKSDAVARTISAERAQIAREKRMRLASHRFRLGELHIRLKEQERIDLCVIVKADVQGSVEVLRDSMEKLSDEQVNVVVIHGGVGRINESDVILATASGSMIVGFHVRPDPRATLLAQEEEVEVRLYKVIYEAIDDIKAAKAGLLKPQEEERVLGSAEVRQTFTLPKVGTVAGCHVVAGTVTRQAMARLIRNEDVLWSGKIGTLKRFKDDVKEVTSGYDCGMGLEGNDDIQVGDLIEAYVIEEVARKKD